MTDDDKHRAMSDDLAEPAGEVLEGVTPGPWMADENSISDDVGLTLASLSMSVEDEDIIEANARFIAWCREGVPALLAQNAALRAERDASVRERDNRPTWQEWKDILSAGYKQKARAERLEAAMREIADEASVPVHTWKNGINFKKMYEGWRKIAVERIDIARAALKGADHE